MAQRTSSTGAVLSSDLYDAYGARSSTGGTDVFGYEAQAGYYTDSDTGLILCTHRFYDPSAGRWLTRDPFNYKGGINLYEYVGNNSVNEVDTTGLAQAVVVWTWYGAIQHEYLIVNCGGGPTQSFGFYPGPGGFDGVGDIHGSPGSGQTERHGPQAPTSPTSVGDGMPVAWNGNPAFGKKLCACIAKSEASPPDYSVVPGKAYVCISWAADMWTCAGGFYPYDPILTSTGLQ